jgi:hypothetical protein
MSKARETMELRQIKKWYDQIIRGSRPTKAELEIQFRGYVDQALLLIRRIDEGQPWDEFIMGIDGAPSGLLSRLSRVIPASSRPFSQKKHRISTNPAESSTSRFARPNVNHNSQSLK